MRSSLRFFVWVGISLLATQFSISDTALAFGKKKTRSSSTSGCSSLDRLRGLCGNTGGTTASDTTGDPGEPETGPGAGI